MYLPTLPQPVEQAYGGGDALNVRTLRDFCASTQSNFNMLSGELNTASMRLADVQAINKQLIQFMNWLAVTNPQILDEFQTTANAFEKLSPRDEQGYAAAQAGP